ncbi:MAG: hypothetical protein A3F54_02955 [Candidatus Kerfeldbacteria bacterium RIFCSPHIGHO2_12_FULL_48_17]|uniref:Uncharacterized protein n=1 Tax=Candidatus Kerfeldbacteria bacterium RIFCSPHIGHO2_12_FULL_48_17 TaxID=1798542 RepID=A0A1G2B9G8_9BACT|nr:MAG: hypothetical protein A3F54_02955 [Candidatus Kerfeldbacteria bacterium RIFCSPHIGHO2_12_FULL_48_17]
MPGKSIAIVGASGVGKSYLALKLHELVGGKTYVLPGKAFPGKAFLEPEWHELPEYVQHAFSTQTNLLEAHRWFRNQAVAQMMEAENIKKSGSLAILDTFLQTNIFFAQVFLKGEEKKTMLRILRKDLKRLAWPDAIIYLKAEKNFAEEKRRQRGDRHEVSEANKKGNARVAKKIGAFFSTRTDVVTIDRTDLDFDDSKTLMNIAKKINLFS